MSAHGRGRNDGARRYDGPDAAVMASSAPGQWPSALGFLFLARPLRPALQNFSGAPEWPGESKFSEVYLLPRGQSVMAPVNKIRTRVASVDGRNSSGSPKNYRIRVRLIPNPATSRPPRDVDFLDHENVGRYFVALVRFDQDLIKLDLILFRIETKYHVRFSVPSNRRYPSYMCGYHRITLIRWYPYI